MSRRADLEQRQSKLSPAKRAILEEWALGTWPSPAGLQAIPQRTRKNRVPLSFAQERLWFLNQLEPDSPAYNITRAVRLSGPLNLPALEQTLNDLVRRHETLRTTFSTVDGRPEQVIAAKHTIQLPLFDLRSLPETERLYQAQCRCTERARNPFDLTQGPLFRPALLRLGREDHILLLTMHHIISDGWSMGVIFREISVLYQAFSAGKPAPHSKLPVQYADYALWQREWLQGEVLETQLAYWKEQLAGTPEVLALPTDHTRPQEPSGRGAVQSLTLSKALADKLRVLSQREGVTLFMVCLAAFQTLLHRYTGQEDIVVGSPIANRTRAELEDLIGFFVNTLVLRVDLSGNPTFRELLGRVREVCLGAYAHQDLPFEKIVEVLQPVRDPVHPPLFQTMLVLQNTPAQALDLPGLCASAMHIDAEAPQFDLTLVLMREGEGLRAKIGYRTDLFEAPAIERMLGHLQTLLEGIVAGPSQRIADLPLLTRAEEHQMLVTWNDTRVDFGPDLCMHRLFERQVERTPDAVALVFKEQQLTYRQLNTRANQMARHLQGLGAEPEMLVGLFLERTVERVVAMLGILKAGAAFLSLDPAQPRQHLALNVEGAQMSFIVTTEAMLDRLPDCAACLVSVDTEQRAIARENGQNPESTVTAANLAYMIYTSGSTGRPKGVMIEHAALGNFLLSWYDYCDMGAHTHRLDNTSLSYDVWVASITIPLCCGGVLQLAPEEVLLPGPELIRFLQDTGVSQFTMVPSAFRLLPEAELPSLQTVITGGEVVTADLVARWAPGRTFLNGYGPTEATINTTVYQCTGGDQAPPIGRPMANIQVFLLDAHLQPVPIGVPGELCIGGAGLARGYLNQPGLTAEKFIPDSFSSKPGARLYRTGDLARYRPDGNIEFIGRIDHQVKIRGFRVEMEEIEEVLVQHPMIQEAIVVTREDVAGDCQLAAYVVPNQDPAPTPGELSRFLRGKLPAHMVPSAYIPLDALPLTASGKLDRRALPAPEWSRDVLEGEFVAPRTPVEKVLADIWSQVLGVQQIGVHDNFFELGGHSLLATQIISRTREIFRLDIALRAIFEAPTVAEMSQTIIAQETTPGQVEQVALLLKTVKDIPLEGIQRMLKDRRKERGLPDTSAS